MSNSRRRDEMEVGVGESAERVRSMLPFCLTNCKSNFGVNAGPSPRFCELQLVMIAPNAVPFDFEGRSRMWSKARSPCWNKASLSFFGDSYVSLKPRSSRHV